MYTSRVFVASFPSDEKLGGALPGNEARVFVHMVCQPISCSTYSEFALSYEWNVSSLVDSSVGKNRRSCSGDGV